MTNDYQEIDFPPVGVDEYLWWQPHSTEPIELYFVPGTHETLVREPHVAVLAAHVNQCLQKADAIWKAVQPIAE